VRNGVFLTIVVTIASQAAAMGINAATGESWAWQPTA
jgi:hypothetical protein